MKLDQVSQGEVVRAILQMMAEQVSLLSEIRDQLAQMNQSNDQDSDPCAGEPDMFATLNGPRNAL